jgi:hypothetical protein
MAPTTERSAAGTVFVLADRLPNCPTSAIRREGRFPSAANRAENPLVPEFGPQHFVERWLRLAFAIEGWFDPMERTARRHGFTPPTRTAALDRAMEQGVS